MRPEHPPRLELSSGRSIRVALTPGAQDQDALLHQIDRKGDVGGDGQVPLFGVLADVPIRHVGTADTTTELTRGLLAGVERRWFATKAVSTSRRREPRKWTSADLVDR